jgi:hypothetical protein
MKNNLKMITMNLHIDSKLIEETIENEMRKAQKYQGDYDFESPEHFEKLLSRENKMDNENFEEEQVSADALAEAYKKVITRVKNQREIPILSQEEIDTLLAPVSPQKTSLVKLTKNYSECQKEIDAVSLNAEEEISTINNAMATIREEYLEELLDKHLKSLRDEDEIYLVKDILANLDKED